MKKIIFMGTPDFAASILAGLIQQIEYDVIAVVTQPDRPVGRKRILTPPPVKTMAQEAGLLVLQPEHLANSPEYQELMMMDCDLIVTAAYGQKIPNELLLHPRYGAINVHASLLPKYRGGAPIHYAIWKGEKETGVSLMQMVEEMDAGPVLAQAKIPIQPTDDVGILFEKLAILGRELLLNRLVLFFEGQLVACPQDSLQVSYSPTIKKHEEQLDWKQKAEEIDRHIRAFRPFPTTYSLLAGERVKLWQTTSLTSLDPELEALSAPSEVGTIIACDADHFYVLCGQSTYLAVSEFQPAGKKRMPVAEFLKGTPPQQLIGQRFESKR